jgi:hypothetical protein
MSVPGFTAEWGLVKPGPAGKWASAGSSSWRMGAAKRVDVSGSITPARPTPEQQDYIDCVNECLDEGGDPSACSKQCKTVGSTTPVGHGTDPGTSDAQVACCLASLALCMGFNWSNPFGMAGCMLSGMSCTTTPPCNGL